MKRSVVMILLAGALTLSMIAPSALPAVAGNVSVVHAAEKSRDTVAAEKSDDAAAKTLDDAVAETLNDATAKTLDDAAAEASYDEDSGEQKDKTETVYVDANADGSV